jgi:hypothetical protein
VEKPFQQRAVTGLKTLDAALALVALVSPKLPNAALPQALLSPAKKSIFKLIGYISVLRACAMHTIF